MSKKHFRTIWKSLAFIFMLAMALNGSAQSISVTGKVTDVHKVPIIGAKVVLKNDSKHGAITNMDGKFTINKAPANGTLVVSYIGMKTIEVPINNKTKLNIVLQDESSQLNELVVVGYGTQKKVNVTGSVSTVDAKQLEARPVQNVVQALQGTVPGLNMSVGNGGGALGSSMSFNIRGGGTIGQGSSGSPLVLIDGVEGDINALNPNDIANISVLKDAASSSIYGARGAFGVILITTKSGKRGQTRITYSGNIRYNSATQVPEMVNSLDFANTFNDAQRNNNGNVIFDNDALANIKKFLNHGFTDPKTPEYYGTTENVSTGYWNNYPASFANTNWFNEFYAKNVPSYENNLSVSGGADKYTYLISLGMLDQNGLLRHGKDTFKRLTVNAKMTIHMYDWLKVNFMSKFSNEDYKRPQYLDIGGLFFHNIARRWPTCPAYVFGHPMRSMEINELEQGGVNDTNNKYFTNQLQFIFEPVKDWHINIESSMRNFFSKQHSEVLKMYEYNAKGELVLGAVGWNAPGYTAARSDRSFNDYYQFNIITDYSKTLDKHYFKIMGGMNTEFSHNDWMHAEGSDLISDNVPYLSATQDNAKVNDAIKELALAGFFGRINYNYDERYLIEANLRYDGSSRFVGKKRWGLFPSFSLGWNVANEGFFSPLKDKVSSLKLRASWGQLGNNATKSWYPFFQSMPTGKENSRWLIGDKKQNTSGIPDIVSSLLTWERVESWDLGFDFAAFNNRLTGTFDYFNRFTYDMVGPAPELPAILGTTPPRINNADLKSYGWELQLNWRDQIGAFRYGIGFNISDSQRQILRYPNKDFSLSTEYYDGKMLGDIWGYTTVGLAQSQEQMDKHLAKNLPNWGSKWAAGDVMYKDLNGDGKVSNGANTLKDHGDLKIIGNSTPRYNFGLNLNMSYKGIDASLFVQGVGKRDYWLDGAYFWGIAGGMWHSTVFQEHLNYWTENNKGAYYPRPIFNDGKNHKVQTRYLQDASYMRVKNIQLGYTLPADLTHKVMVSKMRMYLSVDNLYTFTKLNKVFDPEALGGQWGPGKLYPLQRTVSVGVNINF